MGSNDFWGGQEWMNNLLSQPRSPQPIFSEFGGDGVGIVAKGVTKML